MPLAMSLALELLGSSGIALTTEQRVRRAQPLRERHRCAPTRRSFAMCRGRAPCAREWCALRHAFACGTCAGGLGP